MHTYLFLYIYLYLYMYTYVYICIYIHTYKYTYIHAYLSYIHTYIHIYMFIPFIKFTGILSPTFRKFLTDTFEYKLILSVHLHLTTREELLAVALIIKLFIISYVNFIFYVGVFWMFRNFRLFCLQLEAFK
jgi:hypothetical protein